jgi:hypothetical protein
MATKTGQLCSPGCIFSSIRFWSLYFLIGVGRTREPRAYAFCAVLTVNLTGWREATRIRHKHETLRRASHLRPTCKGSQSAIPSEPAPRLRTWMSPPGATRREQHLLNTSPQDRIGAGEMGQLACGWGQAGRDRARLDVNARVRTTASCNLEPVSSMQKQQAKAAPRGAVQSCL